MTGAKIGPRTALFLPDVWIVSIWDGIVLYRDVNDGDARFAWAKTFTILVVVLVFWTVQHMYVSDIKIFSLWIDNCGQLPLYDG